MRPLAVSVGQTQPEGKGCEWGEGGLAQPLSRATSARKSADPEPGQLENTFRPAGPEKAPPTDKDRTSEPSTKKGCPVSDLASPEILSQLAKQIQPFVTPRSAALESLGQLTAKAPSERASHNLQPNKALQSRFHSRPAAAPRHHTSRSAISRPGHQVRALKNSPFGSAQRPETRFSTRSHRAN